MQFLRYLLVWSYNDYNFLCRRESVIIFVVRLGVEFLGYSSYSSNGAVCVYHLYRSFIHTIYPVIGGGSSFWLGLVCVTWISCVRDLPRIDDWFECGGRLVWISCRIVFAHKNAVLLWSPSCGYLWLGVLVGRFRCYLEVAKICHELRENAYEYCWYLLIDFSHCRSTPYIELSELLCMSWRRCLVL